MCTCIFLVTGENCGILFLEDINFPNTFFNYREDVIRIRKKKILIIISTLIAILLVLAGVTVFILQNQMQNKKVTLTLDDGTSYYDDGTMSLAEGSVAYGLFDLENEIYDADRTGNIENNAFSAIASYQQNLPGISNYMAIIMVDYKQVEFEVDGNVYRNYPFSLEDADECNIKFKISNLPKDAHEMAFLVFNDPNCMELSFTDEGWENISNTHRVYAERLLFSSSKGHPDNLSYMEGTQMDKIDDGVNLSQNSSDITILPEAKSGEEAYLFTGNYYEEDADYVALAFCNWQQVDLLPGIKTFYYKIPSHKTSYYKIELPKVQKDSTYQIIVFNMPFGDVNYFYDYQSTTRTIIRR